MKTLALLAVLLGWTTIAAAQPMPASPEHEPDADSTTDDAVAPAPTPHAPEAPVAQIVDADLPPAATVVAPRTPDPRAMPSLRPSPVAEADDNDDPLGPDEYVQGGRRSPGAAFALSGGTTVAGIVMLALAGNSNDEDMQSKLVVGGLLALAIGPTTGHIYAGDTWNTGLKVRLSGLGMSVLGLGVVLAACPPFGGSCSSEGAAAIGGVAFLGGGLLYASGTIYEIVDAPRAADRYNMRHRASLAVVPSAGGKPGMSVVGTF